jgi:type I restriction enzyme S subunit
MFGDPVRNEKKWKKVPLSECLEGIESGSSYNCEPHNRKGSNPAILKLSAVTYGTYNPDENKELPTNIVFDERVEVLPGDLLFSRKNTLEMVGMSAYVYNTPPKLLLPDLIFRLVTRENCNRIFLWRLINHPESRLGIQSLASGSAASMPNISKQRLVQYVIPFPPIYLQNRIAEFVRQADKSKFELQRTLDELEATHKALLRKTLS